MEKEVYVSSIQRQANEYVIYFDLNCIEHADKISKVYLMSAYREYQSREAEVLMNHYLTQEECFQLGTWQQPMIGTRNTSRILCDITESVLFLKAGGSENKGLLVHYSGTICSPKILLIYQDEKIFPCCTSPCGGESFYEKKLWIRGFENKAESPWFYSGASQTITFFAKNLGQQEIEIHLENSPNADDILQDAQLVVIQPQQTADIVPYKFSKFTRLVALSPSRNLLCKMWFQTQLLNSPMCPSCCF